MSRHDYILRLIEEFGRFAVALRNLILGQRTEAAAVERELQGIAQHAGIDLELARIASLDTLMLLVAPGGDVEPARCWMCAEVLYLDGLDAHLSGESERARTAYGKARVLFSMVAPMGAFLVGFPEASERVVEIDGRLGELDEGTAAPPRQGPRPRRLRAPARR